MLTMFSNVFAAEPTTNNKINALMEAGLVQGDANGYRLDETIAKAEVITMLVRLQGKEDIASTMKTMPGSVNQNVLPTAEMFFQKYQEYAHKTAPTPFLCSFSNAG